MSEEKQHILKGIEEKLNDELYKIYIKDFRINDGGTKVVVEYESGNTNIVSFIVQEDGYVFASSFYPVDSSSRIYTANQYKKAAIILKNISIK